MTEVYKFRFSIWSIIWEKNCEKTENEEFFFSAEEVYSDVYGSLT